MVTDPSRPSGEPIRVSPPRTVAPATGAARSPRGRPARSGMIQICRKWTGVGLRLVELAVPDPRAGAHPLDLSGPDDRSVAEAVAVLERTVQHVGDDLHVAMRVGAEPFPGCDAILVDHAQRAEVDVLRVVVLAEREGVPAIQPVDPGMPSFSRAADGDHRRLLCAVHKARAGVAKPGLTRHRRPQRTRMTTKDTKPSLRCFVGHSCASWSLWPRAPPAATLTPPLPAALSGPS